MRSRRIDVICGDKIKKCQNAFAIVMCRIWLSLKFSIIILRFPSSNRVYPKIKKIIVLWCENQYKWLDLDSVLFWYQVMYLRHYFYFTCVIIKRAQ